jgi:hypothetical protein
MSYIGNTVQNQNYVPAIDYFNGDGSTVAFTLSRPVASVAAVQAVISNVPQNPGSAFTVSGSTITFTSAPPSGTSNIYVYYVSPNTQIVQPGQGTVGPTQIDPGYTLWTKSGTTAGYTGYAAVTGTGYSPNINLTDASTIAWDTSTGQTATFTFVSSSRTMGAPTNLVNGGFYALAVIQNGGSNTLTWNSVFKWAGGTAPTLSTAAGAKDYFVFRSDGTNMYEQGRALGDA